MKTYLVLDDDMSGIYSTYYTDPSEHHIGRLNPDQIAAIRRWMNDCRPGDVLRVGGREGWFIIVQREFKEVQ